MSWLQIYKVQQIETNLKRLKNWQVNNEVEEIEDIEEITENMAGVAQVIPVTVTLPKSVLKTGAGRITLDYIYQFFRQITFQYTQLCLFLTHKPQIYWHRYCFC